jgi:APA family basic amino acid/polyamine antiporter
MHFILGTQPLISIIQVDFRPLPAHNGPKEKVSSMENSPGPSSCSDKFRTELPRVLGFWDIVSIIVGGVIGSGIFLVPSDVAQSVGAPLLIFAVWIAGGMLSYIGALAFAEMGAAMPKAGGMYNFLREAFGPLPAFLFGWTLFLVIDSGAIATLTVAFASNYLPYFVKISPLGQKIVAAAFISFLVIVNYLGARWGANLQNLLTVIKFAALAAVCAVVFIFAKDASVSNWVRPLPSSLSGGVFGAFGVALIAVLWAYKGWEGATYSAGEVKRPERNLPIGLLVGTLIVIAIYILANMAYLYVFPASRIAQSPRIASDVMNFVVGPVGGSVISLIILFSMMGAANQTILCSPRVYFAMARDGLFFNKIAECHPRFLTPHISIIALGVWSLILTLLLETFQALFTYVIFGEWIFFGLTVAAVFVLRKKRPDLPRPYRTWGYPLTPAVFILAALYISGTSLIQMPRESIFGLLIIFLGLPAYFYWKRKSMSS